MKAVIPAAGLGTRMLPASKAVPKEGLPVAGKPMVQHAVEEAVDAGCEQVLLVLRRGKEALVDHFDRDGALERHLEDAGRDDALRTVRELAELADVVSVRQPEPLGLGHAVLQARAFVDGPFAVLLPDSIPVGCPSPLERLVDLHAASGSSCFSVEDKPRSEVANYGAIDADPEPELGPGEVHRVHDVVEKPTPSEAPSTLVTMGRYVLEPAIFESIEATEPGHGDEIQLTDAIARLARERTVHAHRFEGDRLDVGNPGGYQRANLRLGLARGQLSPKEVETILTEARRSRTTEVEG